MSRFLEKLGKERLFCDGGTGSVLQGKGLAGGELPERWNLTRPDDIVDLARSYFEAGSDIVNSNTFGANRLHYSDPEELKQVIEAGVAHVRRGMKLAGRDDGFVALDIGPTGRLLKPMGDLGFEEAVSIFAEVVRYGTEAGADLILIETMSDTLEAKAAVLAAKENSSLPVCVTTVFDSTGKMLTGGTVESAAAMLEGLSVDAIGLNCSLGPRQLLPIVKELVRVASVPVICNPNAGLPRSENGKTIYDLSPDEFAEAMKEIASSGVHVLGGCCGTTPEYIRKMIHAVSGIPFVKPVKKNRTVVSSASRAVIFGEKPVLIGERINPTGKKRFKQALREGDLDYISRQGILQEDAGADILDVNVGLPEICEPEMMENVISRLQSILPLPLEIDTTDPAALERGLRSYNGKAMINSVNGKRESLDAVLPLAAKYGGVLVALPIDEGGIPDTAEGRIRIAAGIIREAERYGIPRNDIVVDGLAMTISTDASSALVTLETVRRIRDELHVKSILGVSNISFGLPQREIVNSAFFSIAMREGLSAAIMNPNSSAMMASYRAFCALSGFDLACTDYLSAYSDRTDYVYGLIPKNDNTEDAENRLSSSASGRQNSKEVQSLSEAVRYGMGEMAASRVKVLLENGTDPLDIVNNHLIPALDTVGKGFENGTVFLPQLLMSAEAASAAFEVVKGAMSSVSSEVKGKVILATVKGDIHDIGKNIVKVLLENYGYEVLDLGKDVPPETIVETARREGISLIGLSALMTTTVVSMEETIRQLREEKPDAKVVVGGAVMTQEYADSIGADYYAKEAMDTVRYADRIFSGL